MSWENANSIVKDIIGVLTIVGMVVGGLYKWGRPILHIFTSRNKIPKKTIAVVSDNSTQANYWHMGSLEGKSILHILGHYMVTNLSDSLIALSSAIVMGVKGELKFCEILVKDTRSQYSGSYEIPPNAHTTLTVCFVIAPETAPANLTSLKLKIAVVDQFGNKHWVKNALFKAV